MEESTTLLKAAKPQDKNPNTKFPKNKKETKKKPKKKLQKSQGQGVNQSKLEGKKASGPS